ncbi:MAG: hypothetical protein P1U77_22580 [Rubripirellula sp.]|nr:hypothetical protein [Planctomycetaceae bacterium]MDF1844234.1 hypothetical protein [Rubripirellula sp.]
MKHQYVLLRYQEDEHRQPATAMTVAASRQGDEVGEQMLPDNLRSSNSLSQSA